MAFLLSEGEYFPGLGRFIEWSWAMDALIFEKRLSTHELLRYVVPTMVFKERTGR